jgi:hypothetical protein
MHELQQLARALFHHGTKGALQDPERLKRLRDIVARARAEVESMDESAQGGARPSGGPRIV